MSPTGPILIIDDDPDAAILAERVLSHAGYEVLVADGGEAGLEVFAARQPALILLDIEMPGLNGYAVAERISEAEGPGTPVVFLTAHGGAAEREQALAVGAVAHLVKPFDRAELVRTVSEHIDDRERWERLRNGSVGLPEAITPDDFHRFKQLIAVRAGLQGEEAATLLAAAPRELYPATMRVGVASIDVVELLADFLNLEVVNALDPASVDATYLPEAFGENNCVSRIVTEDESLVFAVSNPFNWELLDVLERQRPENGELKIVLTEPDSIQSIFRLTKERSDEDADETSLEGGIITLPQGRATLRSRTGHVAGDRFAVSLKDVQERPVVFIANNLILETMREGASDIHLEPKEDTMHIRFRVDGDMRDVLTLTPRTGVKLISRLKALGGLDIAERRKPQDGALEVHAGRKRLKLRLATSSGPFGESMVIRVLDSTAAPTHLSHLGMTNEQADQLYGYAERTQGMILIVGPTGSGKTTTIYSVLSTIDTERRSLMSVEDPVEYIIPRANQQQVNEKAGVTFDALLKSSVRQDPDVLFLGEVRDTFSARTGVDFASTGHLTITTLHTSNATSAFFRLERLGVERAMMAEAMLCVVAQRLVKALCPECRRVDPITPEERALLSPYTDDIPEQVAHPVGCPSCGNGYKGRSGVYEVIGIDERIAEWLRSGMSVKELRLRLWDEGAYLIHRAALDKIRDHTFSVDDAYQKVLVEDESLARERRDARQAPAARPPGALGSVAYQTPAGPGAPPTAEQPPQARTADDGEMLIGRSEAEQSGVGEAMIGQGTRPKHILVADDDESTRVLLARVLGDAGYAITTAADGADALALVASTDFDLILSDLNMPHLDGLALIRKLKERGTATPILMLTGSTEGGDEVEALQTGVTDFVHKPVRRDVLLLRVARAIGR